MVRSAMNGFIIAVGSGVIPLTDAALEAAAKVGEVTVIKEGTQCKVPSAAEYIHKAKIKGTLGKKRKMARC